MELLKIVIIALAEDLFNGMPPMISIQVAMTHVQINICPQEFVQLINTIGYGCGDCNSGYTPEPLYDLKETFNASGLQSEGFFIAFQCKAAPHSCQDFQYALDDGTCVGKLNGQLLLDCISNDINSLTCNKDNGGTFIMQKSCQQEYYEATTDNGNISKCLYNFCLLSKAPNPDAKSTFCKDCSIQDCKHCLFDKNGNQKCIICNKDFILSNDSQSCNSYANTDSKTVDVLVTNGQYQILESDKTNIISSINDEDGTGDKPFTNIMKAINSQYIKDDFYEGEVNIYISKGDHFLLFCDDKLTASQYQEIQGEGGFNPSEFINYCGDVSAPYLYKSRYNTNDRIKFNIQPLRCDNTAFSGLDISSICMDQTADPLPRPTIYVNSQFTYFNVTNEWTFKDLIFDGITATAQSYVTIESTQEQFDLQLGYSAHKTCQVDDSQTTDTDIKLILDSNNNGNAWCYLPYVEDPYANQFSASPDANGELYNESFFTSNDYRYTYRRRTLFNLYGIDKVNNGDSQTYPKLNIDNCDFQYFVNDYDSLIYFENNNAYHQGTLYIKLGENKGGIINMQNSKVWRSRFNKGMITYREPPTASSSNIIALVDYDGDADTNSYTNVFASIPEDKRPNYGIYLYKNTFENINYMQYLNRIGTQSETSERTQSFGNTQVQKFMNKGSLINLDKFPGAINIKECTIKNNYYRLQNFQYEAVQSGGEIQYDESVYWETDNQVWALNSSNITQSENESSQRNVLSYSIFEDYESEYDNLEKFSTIFIQRSLGSIIIADNTFEGNHGTYGGAISINSPSIKKDSSKIVIKGNTFNKNFSIMGGNAVHIKMRRTKDQYFSQCTGLHIEGNTFTSNFGLYLSNGGALYASCQDITSTSSMFIQFESQVDNGDPQTVSETFGSFFQSLTNADYTVDQNKNVIKGGSFSNNYTGGKGSAAALQDIQNLEIDGLTFSDNGPAIFQYEELYSSYKSLIGENLLINEISHYATRDSKELIIEFMPNVQGALYVGFCSTSSCQQQGGDYSRSLLLNKIDFINNTEGLYFERLRQQTSSSLYLDTVPQITFTELVFKDHKGNYKTFIENSYVDSTSTFNLKKFMPQDTNLGQNSDYDMPLESYFDYSLAPIIYIDNQHIGQAYELVYQHSFNDVQFFNNYNAQRLAIASSDKYEGSLISSESGLQLNSKIYIQMQWENVQIYDNIFLAGQGLVHLQNYLCNFNTIGIKRNGYLTETFIEQPLESGRVVGTEDIAWALPYSQYETTLSQQIGVIYLDNADLVSSQLPGTLQGSSDQDFSDITCESNYSQQGSCFSIYESDFTYNFKNSNFKYNMANSGGAIQAIGSSTNSGINISIQANTFQGNVGVENGGAINLIEQTNKSKIHNKDNAQSHFSNTFIDNYSQIGGSLSLQQVKTIDLQEENFSFSKRLSSFHSLQQDLQDYFETSGGNPVDYYNHIQQDFQVFDQQNPWMAQRGGAIYIDENTDTDSQILDCVFSQLEAQYGAALYIASGKIQIIAISTNDHIKENIPSYGTLFFINSVITLTQLKIVNNNFEENNEYIIQQGSAFYIENSQVTGSQLIIDGNKCNVGTVYVTTNSEFTCSSCTITNNETSNASALFILNTNGKKVEFTDNSVISNNVAKTSSTFIVIYAELILNQATMQENTAVSFTHGFSLTQGTLNIIAGSFSYTSRSALDWVQVGMIYATQQSRVTISQSHSISGVKGRQGVIQADGRSNIEIDTASITDCQSDTSNIGIINGSTTGTITLTDVTFQNNVGTGELSASSYMSLILTRVTMQALAMNQAIILTDLSSITMDDCTISSYGQKTENEVINDEVIETVQTTEVLTYQYSNQQGGAAIFCNLCQKLSLTDSTFANNNAEEGGAIYINQGKGRQSIEDSIIKGCTFESNQAYKGGALFIEKISKLKIKDSSKFNNNKATGQQTIITTGQIEERTTKAHGYGGAILASCQRKIGEFIEFECEVQLETSDVQFNSNLALNDGGAVKKTNAITLTGFDNGIYDQNSSENTAGYGGDLASTPSQISISEYSIVATTEGRRLNSISSMLSGEALYIKYQLLDEEGNLMASQNTGGGVIYDASFSTLISLNGNTATFVGGELIFDELTVNMPPGTTLDLRLTLSGIDTFSLQSTDTPSVAIPSISTQQCSAGDYLDDQYNCNRCPEKFYLLVPPTTVTSCTKCQDTVSICEGGNDVYPQPDYWRSSDTSENFIKCPNPAACLQGDKDNKNGQCFEGYQGVLCADCSSNFSRSGNFKCAQCPDPAINYIRVIGICAVAALIVIFFVFFQLRSAAQEKLNLSVYLKIMTNHFQLLVLVMSLDYSFPQEIDTVIEAQQSVAEVAQQMFSFDCFLNTENTITSLRVYYQKLIVVAIIPFIVILFAFLIWALIALARCKPIKEMLNKYISTLVVILFLLHPTITTFIFQSLKQVLDFNKFSCIDVDGERRLLMDLEEVCAQGTHLTIALTVSMPSIIFWVIGIPLFAIFLLNRNKRALVEMDNNPNPTTQQEEKLLKVKLKYGFLFAGYRLSRFFWEAVILYRKMGIILVNVFLVQYSPEIQVLVAMFILVVALFYHLRKQPYKTKLLNTIESISILTSIITMYAGMYYITGAHYTYMKEWLKWVFLAAIVIPNIFFLIFWVWKFKQELDSFLYDKFIGLFKCFTCGKVKPEVFAIRKKEGEYQDFVFFHRTQFLDKEMLKSHYDQLKQEQAKLGADDQVMPISGVQTLRSMRTMRENLQKQSTVLKSFKPVEKKDDPNQDSLQEDDLDALQEIVGDDQQIGISNLNNNEETKSGVELKSQTTPDSKQISEEIKDTQTLLPSNKVNLGVKQYPKNVQKSQSERVTNVPSVHDLKLRSSSSKFNADGEILEKEQSDDRALTAADGFLLQKDPVTKDIIDTKQLHELGLFDESPKKEDIKKGKQI